MVGKIYISKELFINSEYRYTSLSASTAPNLRQKLRVRMINAQGLEEAGVDGGGIFRYCYMSHDQDQVKWLVTHYHVSALESLRNNDGFGGNRVQMHLSYWRKVGLHVQHAFAYISLSYSAKYQRKRTEF